MSIPLVSIVLINFNGLRYLKRSLMPLKKFSYVTYELIVVDNGSTDGSVEFLKKQRSIKLIESSRTGEKNFACNLGVSKAKGKYVLLLDNDIIINDSRLLQGLVESASARSDFGCYALAYANEKETSTKGYGGFFSWYFKKANRSVPLSAIRKMHNSFVGNPQGIGLFIEKALWQKIGGYDTGLKFGGDDKDIGVQIWIRGKTCRLYGKSLHTHIGLPERQDDVKYSRKLKEMIHADFHTIWKDFRPVNVFVIFLGYGMAAFLKAIKQSFQRKSFRCFLAYWQGLGSFLARFPQTLRARKKVQASRTVRKDVFLSIAPQEVQ